MATTVRMSVDLALKGREDKTTDLGTYGGNINQTPSKSYTSSDVDLIFSDSRTLTGSESLDLTGGLTNQFGETMTFATLKLIYIKNTHASNYLDVGGSTNPVLTNAVRVRAGEIFLLTTSTTVTGGATDQLNITASAASTTYDIILLGHT